MSSFRLPYEGLFQPRLLGPKQLHSKWAKLASKIVLYFTHRNGPILGAKTDLFDLQCVYSIFLAYPDVFLIIIWFLYIMPRPYTLRTDRVRLK